MEDTYIARAYCLNCGKDWIVNIPCGTTIKAYEENEICKNCRCGMIKIKPIED